MLAFYRRATDLAGPALRLWLRRRVRLGKEAPARLGERFGQASLERPKGRLIWLHVASLGEAGSILVSVTSTSPGTGTLNGCESVPRMETVPVNVSTTVGGANDPGCVGTGVDATSPLHAAVRTMTPSTGNNLFILFMLLDHAP